MYLLHVAVIAAVMKLGPVTFGLEPAGAALANTFLLVLPATIATSWVTFRIVERPFLKLRVRYLASYPGSEAPAATVDPNRRAKSVTAGSMSAPPPADVRPPF
jgi:peptidoglycan/LPS O-acetylase OafA/YrhL